MTVVELSPNGHGSTEDRVRQAWEPGKTNRQLAAELDLPERTVSYHTGKLRKEIGKARGRRSAKPAATRPPLEQQPAAIPAPEPAATPRRDYVKDAGTVVVAAVMLAVSYDHIVHLAFMAGFGWSAWVAPLPLDGMAVVSIRHLRQERRYWVAWAGIVIGLGGSLVANVVAFDPTLADMRHVGWAFAALPPLAVAVCLHLFDRGNRGDR